MGLATFQGVLFNASALVGDLTALASNALEQMRPCDEDDLDAVISKNARLFLQAVVDNSAIHQGHKGTVCSWVTEANYASAEDLIECLTPFFVDVLVHVAPMPSAVGDDASPEILVLGGAEGRAQLIGYACRLRSDRTLVVREIPIDFIYHGWA